MTMSRQGAERAVVISALTVFGIYAYRLVTEGQTSKAKGGPSGFGQLLGIGSPANIGRFVTGWGFAFLVIAIITEASPAFGGSFAILVGISDFLGNAGQIGTDIAKAEKGATSTAGASSRGAAAAAPGLVTGDVPRAARLHPQPRNLPRNAHQLGQALGV